jgi:hypothetical protein
VKGEKRGEGCLCPPRTRSKGCNGASDPSGVWDRYERGDRCRRTTSSVPVPGPLLVPDG